VPRRGNLWTRRIDDTSWLDRIGPEPYLIQHFIDKAHDIRVVVVGEELFAVAIDSQVRVETSVDLRAGGSLRDLPHRQVDLPRRVRGALLRLCASLHLRFAAIDLVIDHGGRHWFLELNPNGQWAWLEEAAGVQVTEALVRELTG
jgi:glutathione synthase/RimK-type ligase-like ATP-grasp enzyme